MGDSSIIIEELEQEIESLSAELDKAQDACRDWVRKLNKSDQQARKYYDRAKNAEAELQTLRLAPMHTAQGKMNAIYDELSALRDEFSDMRDLRDRAEAQLSKLREENDGLHAENQRLNRTQDGEAERLDYELSQCAAALQESHQQLERVWELPSKALAMCKHRGWDMKWDARGCYLHLESSELIESLRGKGDDTPTKEAADVLLVLMSITENSGIDWCDVLESAERICERMVEGPHRGRAGR